MALLFLDSFDHYQTAEVSKKWTSANFDYVIAAGLGRCGTACLQMGTFANVQRGIAFGSNTVIIGFAFRIVEHDTQPGLDWGIVQFQDGGGRGYGQLNYMGDGSLQVTTDGTGEIGRTAPNLIHFETWYFIEYKTLFHTSAGTVAVRINNVEHINVSGVQTCPTAPPAAIQPSLPPRRLYMMGTSNQLHLIDDLYVLDNTGPAPCSDFLGDCRVEYLKPRAAGAHQEWPTVVGSGGAHWLAVNDNATPDGDGSYVESNMPGQIDTNLYQPTGLPAGQPIFGVQFSLYARKTEIGPRVIAPVVNNVVGTPQVGPSFETYQYYCSPYALNPATSSAWTVATINAIDAGVKVIS